MTSRRFASLTRLAVLSSLVSATALAQTPPGAAPPSDREVWGGGSSLVMVSPLWVGAGAHIGVERGPTVVQIGLSSAGAFWGTESVTSLSVIGGAQGRVGPVVVAALAGPSVVWGRINSDATDGTRLGGVAELSALFEISGRVRVGGEATAVVTSAGAALGGGPAVRVRFGR